jgi:nucleoside-diphosphate-sugar epimerase
MLNLAIMQSQNEQSKMLKALYLNRSVLITGGTGFIGSNLAIRLVSLGAKVTLLDCMMPETGANLFNIRPIQDQVQMIESDVGVRSVLDPLVKTQDFIFNLAGTLSHTDSMKDPYRDLHSNCTGHIHLLDACRDQKSNAKILYTGTRGQYGSPMKNPVDETHPLHSMDTNGINKTAGEAYHLLYGKVYGLKTCSLRLTNTYGPRHQMKHHRQGVLNWFVRRVLDGNPIQVFGTGDQIRDINYVDDVVDALLVTMASEKSTGEVYNLGGSHISLKALGQLLVQLNGSGLVTIIPYPKDAKQVEVGDYIADISKIQNHLGWQPQTTPEEGFQKTLNFYREFKENYWT